MEKQSLLKFYTGNKFIGSSYPVLVVNGDNSWKDMFFGEHYFFMDVPKLPFVHRRDIVSLEDTNSGIFDFNAYPQIFSAESLLKNQSISARAHLEFSLSTLDMKAYKEIFWEGRTFEFTECDDYPLVQFRLYGKFTKEMAMMFGYTRNKKLKEIKDKFHRLPKIVINEEHSSGKI